MVFFIKENFKTEKTFSPSEAFHYSKPYVLQFVGFSSPHVCANVFPNLFRGEEFSCQIEGTLAAEASLIVLDALELMIQVCCYCGYAFFQSVKNYAHMISVILFPS